jgi:predicted LPLAT superfamily acyltransferase
VTWWRRYLVRGVFWRQYLRWGVLTVPCWIEPVILGFYVLAFMFWNTGRRAVIANLKAILPGSWTLTNLFRAYRMIWNFAWTIDDNVRFRETRTVPDWEFIGLEHFEKLQAYPGGAIILTAHMGSYDLGANLFAETSPRKIVMVRAPEVDPQTRQYEESQYGRATESLRIDFNTKAADLAFDLLEAVRAGEIVAIQGDRITPGIATLPATLFGKPTEMPAGPFALAMAARVPIFPLFVIRRGRRFYQLVTREPIFVERRGRDRDADLKRAIDLWTAELERMIRSAWWNWFMFEPFSKEPA